MANVLFLSGWNEHRDQLESMDYCQRLFRSVLCTSGWTIYDKRVTDATSISDAYAALEGMPLLVVYTGHGTGSGGSYPLICPVSDGIDLLNIPRKGVTSYIFDCCNVNDGEKSLFVPAENHGAPVFHTDCLLPEQQFIICMREQVMGFARGTATVLNAGMCGVMYHFKCPSVGSFCELLNGYCNVEYKQRNFVTNKNVKYVITLNGWNPSGRSPVHPEKEVHKQLATIKAPVMYKSSDNSAAPLGKAKQLIEHLGSGMSFDLTADPSDEKPNGEYEPAEKIRRSGDEDESA